MKKRSVFIDMRYLSYLTNGFGQLCLYYGNYFLNNPDKYEDLNITLFVPKEYVGKFGNNVNYLEVSKIYKFFPFLLPDFDVTHSITQQIKYTRLGDKTFRILTIHDLNYLYQRDNKKKAQRKHKQTQARINLADLITVISKFTEEDLKRNFPIINVPVIINYIGLRDITKDNDQKPLFLKSDRKFFFTIGEVTEKKNFGVLTDMMKLMPEYDLYICGNDSSEYAEKIREQVNREQITNVFLTGKISHEEKIWLHRNCHAFVFPSKFEGFGAPVIEAMRFDKPVFSSRMTSLNEIGGKYAFFWENFEPGYMKKIMEKHMLNFYSDTDFRRQQMEYAFSFTIEKHMENFFNLYRTVDLKVNSKPLNIIKNYVNFIKA